MDNEQVVRQPGAISGSEATTGAPAPNPEPAARSAARTSAVAVGWLLMLGVAIVGLTAAGYFGWRWLNHQLPQIAEMQTQQALMLTTLGRQLEEERDARLRLGAEVQRSLGELGVQLNAQAKRLEDLSTTSRDDWLLAEAEYLLRLANQRLLTERQSKGALVLMTAVDDIIGGIDDTRLFPVRQVLSDEISALRLAGGVDREGLYLRLAALADVVMQLQPTEFAEIESEPAAEVEESIESGDLPWYRQLAQNALAALRRFGAEHFRVKTLDKPLEPLLSPDQDAYLQHNIRLGIEQAQMSLLREEQDIYAAALDKAENWLRTYFSMNADAEVVADQLAQLKGESVVQQLPDISRSLATLRDYINLRHRRDVLPSLPGDAAP